MKKIFGTLEHVNEDDKPRWKITGAQPVVMINRIVPDSYSWHGEEIEIDDNIANVEHLDWLMERFPLNILADGVWTRRLNELHAIKKRREELGNLQRVSPSPLFKGKLFEFQQEGLDFMQKTSGNCLLADEMGLGKGFTTLSYLATEPEALPALIVAPLTVLTHWVREIERLVRLKDPISGHEEVSLIKKIRRGKQQELPAVDFYVINYELLEKRADDLRNTGIKSLVLDEVQNLRHMDTGKYRAVKEICTMESIKHKLGLSGTPIYNHGAEIWGIVDILQPEILGSYDEFYDQYCYSDHRGRAIVLESRRQALAERLREDIMLRRRKIDVAIELPAKTRYKEFVDADLDYYYREVEKILQQQELEVMEAKTAFEKHAAYERALQSERQVAGMAKVPYVIKFIKDMMELDESVVVFAHHIAVHQLLHDALTEFRPCSIIGGQSESQRQMYIDWFQEGDSKLMIAAIRAGNLGINLTAASYVVFGELDWTPAVHRQSEDRLHRIGQHKPVFAYYLIGRGTMDEQVASVLVDKTLEIDAVMGDAPDESVEDKAKAIEILAQIQDRLRSKKRYD